MFLADGWTSYRLLDASDGKRLESWGGYTLVRPDPQVIWHSETPDKRFKSADAVYTRSNKGGGAWNKNNLPESWNIDYERLGLKFIVKPMGFKHTGLFPEQAVNWDWFYNLISSQNREIKVLNLFAYTGGATVAAAKAGASVCHVDAARGMVAQAKENAALCGLADAPIRYIVDDCQKFVGREIRRGNKYDAVIMDPPSYGRGPNGQIWHCEENIDSFVKLCMGVLSDDPLFVLINSYTTGLSPSAMGYILETTVKKRYGGTVTSDEVGLPVESTGAALPCGAAARWTK